MLKILPNSFSKTPAKHLRNFALAGTTALMTTIAVSSCKSKNEVPESQKPNIYELALTLDNIEPNRPNLPIIFKNSVAYRNSNNELTVIDKANGVTLSLYEAIQKYSTEQKPDIENTIDFYIDVEKNIPKNEGFSNLYGIRKAISHFQASTLFNKMFDLFTDIKSEKGEAISVKEYTKMMEAWDSTKPED